MVRSSYFIINLNATGSHCKTKNCKEIKLFASQKDPSEYMRRIKSMRVKVEAGRHLSYCGNPEEKDVSVSKRAHNGNSEKWIVSEWILLVEQESS